MRITEFASEPVRTIEDAKTFLDAMGAAGTGFSLDEDAQDIMRHEGNGVWGHAFTDEEVMHLNARINELFDLPDEAWGEHGDVYGYAMRAFGWNREAA